MPKANSVAEPAAEPAVKATSSPATKVAASASARSTAADTAAKTGVNGNGAASPSAAASNGSTNGVSQNGNGDSRPGDNITMQQLASSMMKRRTAAPSNEQQATPATGTEATEEATPEEQAGETDAGANDTELLDADGAAPEGADLTAEEPAEAGTPNEEPEELPKNVRDLQKRVNQLTARLRQTEAREQQLKAGTPGAAATPASAELEAVEGNLRVYRHALEFAEQNPDGGEYTEENGRKKFFTAEQVKTIRRNAEEGKQMALSQKATLQQQAQREFAEVRRQDQTTAMETYPWLSKPADKLAPQEAEMVAEFRQILAQAPELQKWPDYVGWIADAVAGRRARIAGTPGAGTRPTARPTTLTPGAGTRPTAAVNRTPPAVVTRSAAATPRVNPAMAAVAEAESKFKKSGNVKDLKNLFIAQDAAKRTARGSR